jgi:hypothetical protein
MEQADARLVRIRLSSNDSADVLDPVALHVYIPPWSYLTALREAISDNFKRVVPHIVSDNDDISYRYDSIR